MATDPEPNGQDSIPVAGANTQALNEPPPSADPPPPPLPRDWRLDFWEITALGAFVCELITLALFGWSLRSWSVFSILCLLALAAAAAGGLLGFLFGVPRVRTDAAPTSSRFAYNTNLEQISDWLTKILIGATLVQFKEISVGLGRIADTMRGDFKPNAAVGSASSCVVVFSFFAAFIWGYLWITFRVRRELDEQG